MVLDETLPNYRLSSDLYAIDDSLPFILNIFVANFFSLLGTLVVLSYSQVNMETYLLYMGQSCIRRN